MKKFQLIISSFLIFISQAFAQTDFQISLSNSFLGSTTKQLPFWLSANRDGKINPFVSLLNYSELSANVYSPVKTQNNLQYFAGVGVVGGLGNKNYLQLNRLFAGTAYKGWKIEAGMFYDSLRFDGLSTSNGNLARSRNARPYPKVRLSTNSFKPIPFLKKWLSFSFEYDEGILNDERYITRAHLHHKSFYLKTNRVAGFYLQAGIEHFVMWGGTSPDEIIGDLPSDFNSYLYYISGSKGNSDFPQMDQNNIAGNQYGTYQFLISKNFSEYSASINISHPFDDFSGLNWRNWPDNLIGLNIKRNKPDKFINHILYEFTNTRQQSVVDSFYMWNDEAQLWKRMEDDNYFNHLIYISGATYHQQAIGSPLFAPVIITDGISRGFESTRLFSHHLGIAGKVSSEIAWKSLFTYVQYLGTYRNPYQPFKEQLSFLFALNYKGSFIPFQLGISLAADYGQMSENNMGIEVNISKSW